jgi:transposase, IS6 family
MEKRIRWCQRYTAASWRADQTYIKVGGQWAYLYRTIDKNGETIDFNAIAAPNGQISEAISSARL